MYTDAEQGEQNRKHEEYETRMYKETAIVALCFLPIFFLVQQSTSLMNIKRNKDKIDAVVSAGLFHFIGETSGVHEWYIKNGAIVKKVLLSIEQNVYTGSVVCDMCDVADLHPSLW